MSVIRNNVNHQNRRGAQGKAREGGIQEKLTDKAICRRFEPERAQIHLKKG
jgi:hypothetical protein